ncbi:MAG: polyprenyl synthetase family protein [Flavobacterium sp.]|nr:polyprenyl synthetase family protein [Pedobacter sp.]
MQSISQLQVLINEAIADLKYPKSPKELYDPISYLMNLGGKRLRPVCLLMACNLFSDNIHKGLKPALAIEVFHNFTLMHDDIMDNAPIRRGKLTVHKKWNNNVAILSGDVMLVEAYKLIMQVDPKILAEVLTIFNDTAAAVCEGQQIDMNFETIENVSETDYIQMIRLKTAVLLAAALKIGALTGGGSQNDAGLLYDFGLNIGLAFQLHDDILDVYGDPEKFGKQTGGDIIANKKTFLLIKARELASGETKKQLIFWINSTEKTDEKVIAVTKIFDDLNVRQLAEFEMSKYAKKALQSLALVDAKDHKKNNLKTFAEDVVIREH